MRESAEGNCMTLRDRMAVDMVETRPGTPRPLRIKAHPNTSVQMNHAPSSIARRDLLCGAQSEQAIMLQDTYRQTRVRLQSRYKTAQFSNTVWGLTSLAKWFQAGCDTVARHVEAIESHSRQKTGYQAAALAIWGGTNPLMSFRSSYVSLSQLAGHARPASTRCHRVAHNSNTRRRAFQR